MSVVTLPNGTTLHIPEQPNQETGELSLEQFLAHRHTGEPGDAQPVLVVAANKLETPRKINGIPFDGTQDISLPNFLSVADYIYRGLEVDVNNNTGVVSVRAGDISINQTIYSFPAYPNVFNVNDSICSLVAISNTGVVTRIPATKPAVKPATTLRYDLNTDTTIPNTGNAGTNDLTVAGTLIAPGGRIGNTTIGDGTTGRLTSATNLGIPTFATPCQYRLYIDSYLPKGAIQTFIDTSVTKISASATDILTINGVATGYNLNFKNFGTERVFDIVIISTGVASGALYVNGTYIMNGNFFANTAPLPLRVFCSKTNTEYSGSSLGYFEIQTGSEDLDTIRAVTTNFLIPNLTYGIRNLKTLLTPPNSQIIGYVFFNYESSNSRQSTDFYAFGITRGYPGSINSNSYVFSGFISFSGNAIVPVPNLLGVDDIDITYVFSKDPANDTPILPVTTLYTDTTPISRGYRNDPIYNTVINASIGAGGILLYNGTWQTSGYIGCWTRVRKIG